MASFETVVIGANGWMNRNGQVNSLVFKGIDGSNYGPYGKTLLATGTFWETEIPSGCTVQYISGRAGALLDAISFYYYNSPTSILLNTTTTEGMNTDIH